MGRETAYKVGLYFRPPNAYHFASDQDPSLLKVDTGPLTRYYLDQGFHVTRGHWPDVDSRGLPWRMDANGRFHHRYETLSSWALGQWDLYLLSGDREHLHNVLNACDYHVETVDRSDPSCWMLKVEVPGRGHVGRSNGLDHGQAIGILARAFQISHREEYVGLAIRLLDYLERPVSEGGAMGDVPGVGLWLEENTQLPARHILNGMIITLWGLHDLDVVAGVPRARHLWNEGVDSVYRALPFFDSGFWSWYYLADEEPPYIASAKYHGLHIVQLEILHQITGQERFREYARRFRSYADRFPARMHAAARIAYAKSVRQTSRR